MAPVPLIGIRRIQETIQLVLGVDIRLMSRRTRPLKAAALQALVIKPEPVIVPAQQLEFVAVFVAEDEPSFAERGTIHMHTKPVAAPLQIVSLRIIFSLEAYRVMPSRFDCVDGEVRLRLRKSCLD